MDNNLHEKFGTLDRIIGWIGNSDSKSSIMLALVGILISILFTSDFILTSLQEMIKPVLTYYKTGFGKFDLSITVTLVVFLAMSSYLIASLFYLLKSLTAKTDSNQTGDNNLKIESLIYFGSIQKRTFEEYKVAVSSETETEKEEDVLSQIYINSKRCQEKFDNYNKSIRFLKIGIILLSIYIILIQI